MPMTVPNSPRTGSRMQSSPARSAALQLVMASLAAVCADRSSGARLRAVPSRPSAACRSRKPPQNLPSGLPCTPGHRRHLLQRVALRKARINRWLSLVALRKWTSCPESRSRNRGWQSATAPARHRHRAAVLIISTSALEFCAAGCAPGSRFRQTAVEKSKAAIKIGVHLTFNVADTVSRSKLSIWCALALFPSISKQRCRHHGMLRSDSRCGFLRVLQQNAVILSGAHGSHRQVLVDG